MPQSRMDTGLEANLTVRKKSPRIVFVQNSIQGIFMANANAVILTSDDDNVNYLSDVSPKDKVWDSHRSDAADVETLYSSNKEFGKYAYRMRNCSGFLDFAELVDTGTGEISLKLRRASFCRVRTCPVCQWRRSLMWKARFYQSLPVLQKKHPKARFLFLTLTVRNCEIGNLRETLNSMHEGFRNLVRRSEIKKAFLGWIRTTEVTRGVDGTAHPHYHCLLMVKPSYFSKGYIPQKRYVELWQESMGLPYRPNVDIRVVKGSSDGIHSAAAEILKYSVKPEDLKVDPEWLFEYTKQIHKLRFINSGGELKNVLKENQAETDDDMIFVDENPDDNSADKSENIRRFGWNPNLKRYRENRENREI